MARTPPVVRTARAELVGRSEPMEALARAFDRAAGGEVLAAAVSGEPGIGKSRLIADFSALARRRRARVLSGSGYEAEGIPPYRPLIEALRPLLALPVAQLRRALGLAAGDLSHWFPELVDRLGPLPPSYRLPEAEGRLRLFDAVVALVTTAARSVPVVLVVDDVQWADAAALDLLGFLARRAAGARLLVVLAHRDAALDGAAPLARLLDDLNRERRLVRVPLRRLSLEETALLAERLLGGPVSPGLSSRLFEQSEGNPFFVEECLHFLVEEGRLREGASGWTFDGGTSSWLPPSLRATILRRTARLPPGVLAALEAAAAAGRRIRPAVLAPAAGLPEPALDGRLAEAARAGLLTREPGGDWRFAHDKIREVIYAEVPPTRRRELHGRLARSLERRKRAGHRVPTAELAFHYGLAGDARRGIACALDAARDAAAAHAYADAAAHYGMAIELLADAPRGPGIPDEGDIRLELADALTAAGDLKGALASLERALALAEAGRDRAACGRALHRIGIVHARQESLDRALADLGLALEAWAGSRTPEVVEVHVRLAHIHATGKASYVEGERHARAAVALAARLRDRRLRAVAAVALATVVSRANDLRVGERLLRDALALAAEADDPVTAAEASAQLAVVAYWQGRVGASRDAALRREAFALRSGDVYQLRHVHGWLAFLAASRGEWDEADRWLDRAEPILDRLESPEPRAFQTKLRGIVLFQQGRFAEALAHFDAAMREFRRMDPGVLVWYLGWLVLARLELGRAEEAQASIAELSALVERMPAGGLPRAPALNFLGIAAARLGDRTRAEAAYARLRAYAGQQHYVLCDRVLGMLAAALGRVDAAAEHFERAAALARREGIRPELACTRLESGRARLARAGGADRDRAVADLGEGLALATALGMAAAERDARALIGRAGADGPAAARPRVTLSPRQLEVLRLVAEGRSNRGIAEALDVSEKTVVNHVTALFNRLGVDNRAAATAFAFRHRLLPD
ncbi:MAG TPA: AAA family ATPase [Thermodesulfobacteriota bacterium]